MTDWITKALLLGILLAIVLHGLASEQAAERQWVQSTALDNIETYLELNQTHMIAVKALLNQIEIDTCAQAYKAQNVNATTVEVTAKCPSRLGPAWTSEGSWRVIADKQ